MTPDQILSNYEWEVHYYGGGRRHIIEAMEEYAKQEALGLAMFINENGYYRAALLWYISEREHEVSITDDELYELYLKSKSNQTT